MTSDELISAADDMLKMCELFSGLRTSLVNAGWSEEGAEEVVIGMINGYS